MLYNVFYSFINLLLFFINRTIIFISYNAGDKKMNTIFKVTMIYLTLFLTTTIIGSILLYLPVTGRKPIDFVDAFFIATSAFTVTGLSTVDIPNQFNELGYLVILLLIQIGGLGIVTLMIFIMIFTRKNITYKIRELLKYTWSLDNDSGLLNITIRLVLLSRLWVLFFYPLFSFQITVLLEVDSSVYLLLYHHSITLVFLYFQIV